MSTWPATTPAVYINLGDDTWVNVNEIEAVRGHETHGPMVYMRSRLTYRVTADKTAQALLARIAKTQVDEDTQ